jgi:hypothetical protein
MLKDSGVRAARSMQAVGKALLAMVSTVVRHRLTLRRQGRRQWQRLKNRVKQVAMVPVDTVLSVLQYVVLAVMVASTQGSKSEGKDGGGVAARGPAGVVSREGCNVDGGAVEEKKMK